MTTSQKVVSAVVGLWLVALTVFSFVGGSHAFGTIQGAVYDALPHWFGNALYVGTSQQTSVDSSGCVTVGSSGSKACQAQFGTCNLTQSIAGSFAATTTQQFYCSVTGVSAGDLVIADLPVGAGVNSSGAGSLSGGFGVTAAYATTSNFIGVTLANFTGAATSSFPQATTTVEYRVLH